MRALHGMQDLMSLFARPLFLLSVHRLAICLRVEIPLQPGIKVQFEVATPMIRSMFGSVVS